MKALFAFRVCLIFLISFGFNALKPSYYSNSDLVDRSTDNITYEQKRFRANYAKDSQDALDQDQGYNYQEDYSESLPQKDDKEDWSFEFFHQ